MHLAEALRSKDRDGVYTIAMQLKEARHSTGSVQEKLARLKKARENRDT